MSVRVGVIGLGIRKYHARTYQACKDAELVALCDLDEERLQQMHAQYPQARIYTDYREMFADGGLDAVSVAVPNYLHAEVSIAAMRAGLHVLCEKPMALNSAQAEEMLRVSRETGRKLMIHLNYRFCTASQFLKRYVGEGHLGRIYYAQTRWLRARGVPWRGWFSRKELSGGGPLIDLGVHRLDLALWLMGYPRPLTVSASAFGSLGARLAEEKGVPYDVEDLVAAHIRLEGGIAMTLEVSWAGGTDKREEMHTGIYGVQGAAILRNRGEGYDFEALALQDVAGHLTALEPRVFPPSSTAIDHFVSCILEDRAPEPSASQGLFLMRLIEAIYRSAEREREIVLSWQD